MSMLRSVLRVVCAVVVVFVMVPAFAGNGTVILRGGSWGGWMFTPTETGEDLLFVASNTSPPFWCDAPIDQLILIDYLMAIRPNGPVHITLRGDLFSWVFSGAQVAQLPGEEYSDEWLAAFCQMMNTEIPVADGVTHMYSTDNDADGIGGQALSWGHGWIGVLSDRAGTCAGGVINFNFHERFRIPASADYPACYPDCLKINRVGPDLSCP